MKCPFCGIDDPNHTCSEALYGEPARFEDECQHEKVDDHHVCLECGHEGIPTDYINEDGGRE